MNRQQGRTRRRRDWVRTASMAAAWAVAAGRAPLTAPAARMRPSRRPDRASSTFSMRRYSIDYVRSDCRMSESAGTALSVAAGEWSGGGSVMRPLTNASACICMSVCLCVCVSVFSLPLFLQRPLGMRQLITKTLDAILLNTRHPILPSMSVVLAVRNFLEVCYSREDHKRRGYRSAFLSLLHTIAKKIKDDPSLAGIFFDSFPAKENRVS